ncbi:branched-chain amino acid transport system II carrier protein [uncultured Anaerococcus sp.]|uniref:branched-chain amino acid transport system II carrier protein n=1 Tax=uncultured Anaerococcus sp. TaxID=293428 RepID=UPI00261FF62D|nr:branched-chain amino acid transport system II carrier protein [uncultured Anaerococcus sp.]
MDVIIVGFALFSLFFGAGNLIFPPFLGKTFGASWLISSIGFLLTGVGLASLGVIAMAKKDGNVKKFTQVSGPRLGYIITLLVILVIGPLGAIPRTGATSAEVVIASGINISYILFIILFFGITFLLNFTNSKIIDVIGKYLTPALLIVLAVMIIAGIVHPIGEKLVTSNSQAEVFSKSITEGYNTMDALAAMVFSPIVIKSLIDKGYEDNLLKKTFQVIAVASCGLLLVYISLTYLGATSSIVYQDKTERVDLLISITHSILGPVGKYILSSIIALACLTTAVGLTSSISEIFVEIFNDKISYKKMLIIITGISLILSLVGVDGIVNFTFPMLNFAYPVFLTMIVYNLMDKEIEYKYRKVTFTVVTIVAIIQTIIDYVRVFDISNLSSLNKIISWLPFYNSGFPWLVPFILTFILGILLSRRETNDRGKMLNANLGL